MSRMKLFAAGTMLLAGGGIAHAQFLTEGRSTGTELTVLDTEIEILRTGDTGPASALASESFDVSADDATLVLPAIVEVVTSESRTEGFTDPGLTNNDSFVAGTVGNSSVLVLPDDAVPLLDVTANGAEMQIDCNGWFGTSSLRVLDIAGTSVIAFPGTVTPNTTILSPDLPLIILNEQRLEIDTDARSASLLVNAVHVDLAAGIPLAELVVSSVSGAIRDVPANVDCDIVEPPFSLLNSKKTAELVDDVDGDGNIEPGDRVRFTIRAENAGLEAAPAVRVVDRLPSELDVDPDTITVGGTPVSDAIGPCPSDAQFELCEDEVSSECLTVDVGDVAPGAANAVDVVFEATIREEAIDDGEEGVTCNTALIDDVERQAVVDLGDPGFNRPPLNPDPLRTTGSGGCAIGGGPVRGGGEAWLTLALCALAAFRRRSRRPLSDPS